jgi:hypothetical protein
VVRRCASIHDDVEEKLGRWYAIVEAMVSHLSPSLESKLLADLVLQAVFLAKMGQSDIRS